MELLTYILIVGISLIFSFNQKLIKSDTLFKILFFSTYFLLSLVVRAEYDIDINTYANSMSSESMSFYYLKEPIVWFGSRLLFTLTDSTLIVFLIIDAIGGVLVYKTFKNLDVPQYAFFAFLTFFPFILGMQNVYRQWFAAIIFMYLMTKDDNKYFSSGLLFIVAILTHNVAGLFAPIFVLKKKIPVRKLSLILVILAMPVVVFWGASTKSSASTGADLSLVFFVLLIFISFLFVLSGRLIIRDFEFSIYGMILISLYIVLLAVVFLSSASAERVAMFSLMIIYPYLVKRIEDTLWQKALFRGLMVITGFIPLIIFGTRSFVM